MDETTSSDIGPKIKFVNNPSTKLFKNLPLSNLKFGASLSSKSCFKAEIEFLKH